jgi:hypothetical protein
LLPVVSTPIPLFNCPTRRLPLAYPLVRNGDLANNLTACKAPTCNVARTDYAANSGNVNASETGGPGSYAAAATYQWEYDTSSRTFNPRTYTQTGISYQRSEIKIAEIVDGTSSTAMVGERYIDPDRYIDGDDPADDQNIFLGMDRDVNRYTAGHACNLAGVAVIPPAPSTANQLLPQPDRPGLGLDRQFGSAHATGFQMAFCDAGVRTISYDVDAEVWRLMGGRDDQSSSPTQ